MEKCFRMFVIWLNTIRNYKTDKVIASRFVADRTIDSIAPT